MATLGPYGISTIMIKNILVTRAIKSVINQTLLESLILPPITNNIELVKYQHGFRKPYSITSELQKIQSQIANGLSHSKEMSKNNSGHFRLERLSNATYIPQLSTLKRTLKWSNCHENRHQTIPARQQIRLD